MRGRDGDMGMGYDGYRALQKIVPVLNICHFLII